MISRLFLDQIQYDEMYQHVEKHAPLEACGLLAGKNEHVEKVIPVRNQAQSSTRFVMDPYEQLQAFAWMEAQHLELVGIFHSHPAGPDSVSPTDIEEAAYEAAHLVWSCLNGSWKLRGFWIQDGQAREIILSVSVR